MYGLMFKLKLQERLTCLMVTITFFYSSCPDAGTWLDFLLIIDVYAANARAVVCLCVLATLKSVLK